MTPEDINRAIQEHLGWKLIPAGQLYPDRWIHDDHPGVWLGAEHFPNYHCDLNAMHEAEKTLTDKGWRLYVIKLARVIAKQPNINVRVQVPTNVLIGAKAEERSEAFLRTVGKWNDQ